ncbi:sporulation protein YtfJ [Murinocardiopsis flavida]|uniref:Sporulation protein YtfJ n=1 Tax=Murinocardiopsis flavida TaxID=645275 RepID=A0A2P8DES5_9ACTN|nr:spore germination protein GerW family protein [Murinocardiopsis flavida]PSK95712.1 sporulation protein YtfJ [Murinocardiopsis flavida]
MTQTDIPEDVDRQVRARVPGPGMELIDQMVARLGGRATAAAVYGEPVTASGVTVIPVAKIALSIGIGVGNEVKKEKGKESDGGGGGGAVGAVPIGFIEIKDGTAVFVPIRRTSAFALAVPLALIAGWTASRIARIVFKSITKTPEPTLKSRLKWPGKSRSYK